MKLSDVYHQLSLSELKNLAVGNAEDGGIYPNHSDEVNVYLNEALDLLHTRFNLRNKEIIVQQVEGMTLYKLRPEHAATNPTPGYEKFIQDTVDFPFDGDLLRVEEVFGENGDPISLNDPHDPFSVFTPAYDVLQIPLTNPDNAVSVIYRAKHPVIETSETVMPEDVELFISPLLLPALKYYVAYKAHAAINTQDARQNSLQMLQLYESACQFVEHSGGVNKEDYSFAKLEEFGWV